jgi:hypothetical protein
MSNATEKPVTLVISNWKRRDAEVLTVNYAACNSYTQLRDRFVHWLERDAGAVARPASL